METIKKELETLIAKLQETVELLPGLDYKIKIDKVELKVTKKNTEHGFGDLSANWKCRFNEHGQYVCKLES